MADAWTDQEGGSYCPQLHLAWWIDSQTDTTVTFIWYVYYVAHGYAAYTNGNGRDWTVWIGGETQAEGSYNINGDTGTVYLDSGYVTVKKTNSSQTINGTCAINLNINWNGTYVESVDGTSSITIGAKTSYTISYDANGGSGAPSNQSKGYGDKIELSTTKPTRSGYIFQGWATSSGGSVVYASGATYSSNSSITLYAVWKLAYIPPTLSGIYAIRCDSAETASNEGTYAKVYGSWKVDTTANSSNKATKLTLEYRLPSSSTWSSATSITLSGTSGNISSVFGSGELGIANVYYIRVTIYDSGGNTSAQTTLAASFRTLDIANSGKSIAIGKPADESSTLFEVGIPSKFSGGFTENIKVENSGNCNELTDSGKYYIGNSGTNKPGTGLNGWLESMKYSTDYCYQRYTTYTGVVYTRLMSANSWGAWTTEADYVVAQGKCDFWTYRMWNSGIAECWGCTSSTTVSVSSSWGSLYDSSGHNNGFPGNTSMASSLKFSVTIGGTTYTKLFTSVEHCDCNFISSSNAFMMEIGSGLTNLKTPSVFLVRGTSGSIIGKYSYHAIGRWKA